MKITGKRYKLNKEFLFASTSLFKYLLYAATSLLCVGLIFLSIGYNIAETNLSFIQWLFN